MQALSLMDRMRFVGLIGPMRNQIAQRLRAIIAERDISQAEAARLCGLSPPRFNNYAQGLRTPDLDTLMRMARGLQVSTDYLLGFNAGTPDVAGIVLRLLELGGIDTAKAEVISETAQEAVKLLLALPDEGDVETRSRIAAQAAWQLRDGPKPVQ